MRKRRAVEEEEGQSKIWDVAEKRWRGWKRRLNEALAAESQVGRREGPAGVEGNAKTENGRGPSEQIQGDRLSWTGCGRLHNEIFRWSFLLWQQVPCLLVHFSPKLWDYCRRLWRTDLDLCYSEFLLHHCPSTFFWQQSSIYNGIFIQIPRHYAALPPQYASSGYAACNAGIVSPTWPSWYHGEILLQWIQYWLRTGQNICRCHTCRSRINIGAA